MFKRKFTIFLSLISLFLALNSNVYAERDCTQLNQIDKETFNEYCYKVTDLFLDLRNKYKVNGKIDTYTAGQIQKYAKIGLNYLPNSLSNKNYYTHLQTAIERGIKYPESTSVFDDIETTLDNYIQKTHIQKISGNIDAYPDNGNAPLTVTLRANVEDPSGTKLENYNYTWWVKRGAKKEILGNKVFLNYTFREEGNHAVFLDVTSNHRNEKGNTDVLPLTRKIEIKVKEKAASVIIGVNGKNLGGKDELKFNPQEGKYGLLVDASSSIPASGVKFIKTEWDFGNGITKEYDGGPKIERVVYALEGTYNVVLKLKINAGEEIKRKFRIIINNPIAKIKSTKNEGFLGDEFNFSAESYFKNNNLNYKWEIVNLKTDKVEYNKSGSNFTYFFKDKGTYNVKLSVETPAGETDYDNKVIYINSRAPVAKFEYKAISTNKPNTIFFDATKSYDLDYTDEGKLKYNWIIDGNRLKLNDSNNNGATGYYTFNSVGDHSVILEIIDLDNISSREKKSVKVNSILSLDFKIIPRVSQVGKTIMFTANSKEARFFEWDFGDGTKEGTKNEKISHRFKKAGNYNVKLTVKDKNDKSNTFSKNVYIGNKDKPLAFINVGNNNNFSFGYKENSCNGKGAYIVDRINNVVFSAKESIDINGKTSGLKYSWKLENKYYTKESFSKRFDELGCFKVKLSVKSQTNGKEDSIETYVKVVNLKPTFTNLKIDVVDINADPVIVNLKAVGAKDPDGVIQSYIWYYYTNIDPENHEGHKSTGDSTSFALPKINGTYYFAVSMKDNNEEKIDSDKITDSKYFVTLTGDNINTPILSLNANNTSVLLGEDITFTANVENIMGTNLNNKVLYSWDFNEDGFYDNRTKTNTITHKFDKAGKFNVKLKVNYIDNKQLSNTKIIKVNVSNILKPDFDYISIGNKYIFLDKTTGVASQYYWDMGDKQTNINKGNLEYKYNDSKSTHIVKLKVEDNKGIKETSKKVSKSYKNKIIADKNKISLFSNYSISGNKINLKEKTDFLYIYPTTNLKNVEKYIVDFDISIDSDLNGGNDDDEDNKNNKESYKRGGAFLVKLNDFKEQTLKVTLKDETNEILASKDLLIEKEYIVKEESGSGIELPPISDEIKKIFEKIELEINKFPKGSKLKGLDYLNRLKSEWSDKRERTQIILYFEKYIEESKIKNSTNIIKLLKILLSEGKDLKEKELFLKALKDLTPKEITCSIETGDKKCYDFILSKLDEIFESSDINKNREIGKIVLNEVIASGKLTNKNAEDYTAILKKLIYNGNIPTQGPQIEPQTTKGESSFMSLITKVFKVIFYIILFITGIILLFFIAYKIFNKNGEKSFTEFVQEKTSGNKTNNDIKTTQKIEKDDFDPLADFSSNSKKEDNKENNLENIKNIGKKSTKKEETPDWLNGNFDNDVKSEKDSEENNKTDTNDIKSEEIDEEKTKTNNENVPDWLKGNFDDDMKPEEETKTNENNMKSEKINKNENDEPKLETKEELDDFTKIDDENNDETQDENVPDWLKGSFDDDTKSEESSEVTEEKKKEEKIDNKENSEPKLETKEELDDFTKIEDENNDENLEIVNENKKGKTEEKETKVDNGIPDWLKGSFDDDTKSEESSEVTEEKKKEEKTDNKENFEPKLETKEELDDFTKIEDENNDESLEIVNENEKKTTKTKKSVKKPTKTKKEKSENNNDDENLEIVNENKSVENKKKTTKKATAKKKTTAKKTKTEEKVKTEKKATKTSDKKENDKKDELWDDGMKVPDWLKTED